MKQRIRIGAREWQPGDVFVGYQDDTSMCGAYYVEREVPEANTFTITGPLYTRNPDGSYTEVTDPGEIVDILKAGGWKEAPDVPTRVVGEASECHAVSTLGLTTVVVPDAWAGEDCTVIKGRDELPEWARKFIECVDSEPQAHLRDFAGINAAYNGIRSRWPEAFKP